MYMYMYMYMYIVHRSSFVNITQMLPNITQKLPKSYYTNAVSSPEYTNLVCI